MKNFEALTLRADGILFDLKTDCAVSLPYYPIMGGSAPKSEKFIGLWDTGATGSVITKKVADKLNLKPSGKKKVYHANGNDIVNEYIVNLYLPNGVAFSFVRVTEGKLNGMDVLIGMNIISRGDFSLTNVNNKTVFSFRYPSIKTIDYVEEANNIKVNMSKKLPAPKIKYKNQPCSCGSGKPFRKCHGRKR